MNFKKAINRFKNIISSRFCCLSFIFLSCSVFADTSDPLAAIIKPQVIALFGPGSTISICIYIGEIVLGAIGYAKTKNPLLFLGVPLLVLFTSGMFQYISS